MTDPTQDLDSGNNSAVASDASLTPNPIPNSAAASDTTQAPPVPINPDDLHDLFAGTPGTPGHDDEDPLAQLRNDPNYAELIRELEYIATQARLLFAPAEEAPSDEVWSKIQSNLPPQQGN